MEKEQFIKRIIWIEIIGFIGIILTVWLDEIIDIPHIIFGTYATPPNYTESLFESFLSILLACITIFLTYKILQRLKWIEGLLPICSFWKKIRFNDIWIPIEQYIVPDVDKHVVGTYERRGTAVFENGEIAAYHTLGTFDFVDYNGPFHGYDTFTYKVGSTTMTK